MTTPPTIDAPPSGVLPWTRSCFVCGEANPHGLHLKSRIEDGIVVLDYTTRDADRGYRRIVHGGISTTLLDEVMTWAAIVALHRVCVAAEMTTRLRKPLEVGQRIRVEGRVTVNKRKLVLAEGRILDRDHVEIATATGKYVPMPPELADLCEKDFVHSEDTLAVADLMGTTGSA